jgi:Tetratricopeptide repeat
VLGEHPGTLTIMANLASTYRDQGRRQEAEELEAQVMETRSRMLGTEHPGTLTVMANLASTFLGSRSIAGGGRAGGASDGDEVEGTWDGAPRHAGQHEQSCFYVEWTRQTCKALGLMEE